MKLLTIAPDDKIGRWLAALCDARPAYRLTRCRNLDEALTAITMTADFDWIVVETATGEPGDTIARLRLAGYPGPIVQLQFEQHAHAAHTPLPSLVCIVENRTSGPRVLDCRLAHTDLQAADAVLSPIFEYRGPHVDSAANG